MFASSRLFSGVLRDFGASGFFSFHKKQLLKTKRSVKPQAAERQDCVAGLALASESMSQKEDGAM